MYDSELFNIKIIYLILNKFNDKENKIYTYVILSI